MKVAVAYENGQVFQHFGRTEQFKVYEIADGEIKSSELIGSNGVGHGALAGVLSDYKIDALICGGIGGGAQSALSNAGVRLFAGVTGAADQAVEAFLAGSLAYIQEANCDHHEHHDGECGCGTHHEHHGGECGCGTNHEHHGGECGCGTNHEHHGDHCCG